MKFKSAGRLPVLLILLILSAPFPAFAQRWSFAVFSDNRNFETAFRNVLQDMNSGGPADPKFSKPDFVVGAGDIDPVVRTCLVFRQTMGPETAFIPVRGNHEGPEDVRFMLKDVLPSVDPPVTLYDGRSATFYYDHKNIRLIVIDQYAPYAENLGGRKFLKWVEDAVVSAKNADHVFISFHEPRFPADVHTDPFWSMLLKHTDKVRAVLAGHTHVYGRRFLSNSRGGIDLINVGAAGNTHHFDGMNTFVQVGIDGKDAVFRAVQAPDKTDDFKVADRWEAKRQ
ncbi:MAG TPA: metallophosphoesterase [Syntrophobacteraceae bacterium]|nr:metallophosphoesterase [Syntrophobacteraceae bacterium]